MPPTLGPDSLLPSLAVGFALLTGGFSLLRWHGRQARELLQQTGPTPGAAASSAWIHARRQLRRRCQIAWLLVLLGVLVPLGDWWVTREPHPVRFTLYVLLLLTLSGWLLLLGLIDGLALRSSQPLRRTPPNR
ncbi:MAG: hypothetical protein ACKOGA_11425 [Planctomycetaceae bacterium]